jgi:serine protease inhibitor
VRSLLIGLLPLAVIFFAAFPVRAQKIDPEIATLVQGNNEFGIALYKRLAEKDGNVFLSPYSISNALAMTYAGARGNTAAQMKTTLHFNLADERLHPAFARLIASLHDIKKEKNEPEPLQLVVANRLWGQKDFGFLPDFLKIGADNYKAGLQEVDYIKNTEAARETINAWVEKQTNQKIKNLLAKGILTVDTRLVLTNAIYFKANWREPFNETLTKNAKFHLADGKSVETPMMAGNVSTNFADLGAFTMVSLPYSDYRYSMIVLLPKKKDGLADLEKKLTATDLTAWIKKMSYHAVNVKLPKFKVTAEFQLNETLKQMGMADAFTISKADLSGMTTRQKLYLSAVVHKAYVDVNEKGTEAAASTAVVASVTSAPPPATFHADHPFLFLIHDRTTGSILFAGRLANPAR